MGIAYAAAYRAGIMPWEKASREDRPTLERLLDREEADRGGGHRRAIDLGCGRGAHTRLLVDRGWDAIGVDNVREAVDVAVRRSGLDDARFVIGDVRHLVHCGVGSGFDLFLDVGCFQGLDDVGRTMMGAGVTALAKPGATVLVRSGRRRRGPIGSRGATRQDLERAFRGWTVEAVDPPDIAGAAAPSRRTWYRLTRP